MSHKTRLERLVSAQVAQLRAREAEFTRRGADIYSHMTAEQLHLADGLVAAADCGDNDAYWGWWNQIRAAVPEMAQLDDEWRANDAQIARLVHA